MNKKLYTLLMLIVLVFALTSCTKEENEESVDGDDEEYTYTTPQTDSLKLTEDYEGKDFIEDGIGVVTVSQYVDGDTTIFKSLNGTTFTVRYLGINTPESTYKVEPWGFAASKYTKQALKKASKIVLTCEDINDRLDSTGKRYLGWVWLIDESGDSRLLNLELAELAYAQAKANSTQYADLFTSAIYQVTIHRCRIYGETDPDYDYSTEAKSMSLKEIREEYGTLEASLAEKGKGTKVVVTGVIARMNGVNSCYIQQYDKETNEYYGVYVYGGFTSRSQFAVGNTVVIEAKIGYYYGSLQLTDPTSIKLSMWADSSNPDATVHKGEITDLSTLSTSNSEIGNIIGRFVKVSNLTVTGGSDSDTNAFTIKCSYGTSNRIDIRVDANIVLKDESGNRITSYQYFVGKTISAAYVIVGYYDYNTDDTNLGYIQLFLTSMDDIEFAE